MKVLLITFSDNADHQDITFGMFESIYNKENIGCDIWVMGINSPKVDVMDTSHTILVDCPKRPGIERKSFDFITLYKIIKWINSQHFDVIFFETLHLWNLPIMFFCHGNTKIFQMIHDLIPHKGDKQETKVHLMNKAVCKLSDFIVLCNRKYLKQVTEIYGVSESRVKYVDMWRRFPKYTEPTYSKRVLFFGRMNPYKGIDNLIKIVRMCPDIYFDVVGKVDAQVQYLVDELSTLPNVSLNTGYISNEEMKQVFTNVDWVVLPYNSATQSGVIIDGYRYGRPCIAFDVGAISEQVCNGISGFLVVPGDNDKFVETLKIAVSLDREAFRKLSKLSYEYGIEKYSNLRAFKRFIDIIS